MALDGPYTLGEFIRMTARGKSQSRGTVLTLPAESPRRSSRNAGIRAKRTPQKHRLLGVDPGTRFVGWGLVEMCDNQIRLLDYGCIVPPLKLDLKNRLRIIFEELEAVLSRTTPHAAALEETFAGVNMKSTLAMGEGRGVALLCLARANLEVLEISPRSIKQAVTGNGASGKAQVAAMVAAHLGLKKAPEPEHVSDALAAAIALARRYEG